MKNSIDKLDLGFDDDQPDIISPEPKPEPTIHKKKSPTKQKADKNKKELVEDKKSKKSKQ